jgi:hypothetical protein
MSLPPQFSAKDVVPSSKSTTAGPGVPSAALGSRSLKNKPVTKSTETASPIPSDKPAPPGAEPKLMPEAEAARKGGMMARIPAAPEGVLPEKPDPRTSYQVKPGSDDSSSLIKIGPASVSPKIGASGIDTGTKETQAMAPAKPKETK